MRLRRRLRPALITAAAGVACLALGTPAVAADDPRGNNGTVKIGDVAVDNVIEGKANRPHVPCDFEVKFFDFDDDQTAKITFTIHPPSADGGGNDGTVLLSETKTISDDPAGGGQDQDAVYAYSGSDFGLERFKAHPKQGYHVKLTIESDGVPGGVKHKVFWLKCETTPSTPSSPPPPSSPENPPPSSPGGNGGGNNGGGSLPITGVAAGGIALAGLALVGGGVALLVLRRRRDDVTFTA
jgi:LPXTG-motif cell wall-anchored protein